LLFIVREFVVLAARHVAALAHITISVSKWGKCKTMLQFAYLALCLIPDVPEVAYARWVMLIAAVVASVGSMLTYVYRLVCRMP